MPQNPTDQIKRNIVAKPADFITANKIESQILPARRLRPTLEELKLAGTKECGDGKSDNESASISRVAGNMGST